MAGPFIVTGAHQLSAGPFEFDGNLYVVANATVVTDSGDNGTIGLFKSTDDGATWSLLDSQTLASGDDISKDAASAQLFSVCADIDFDSNGYLYLLYAATDGSLTVARADCGGGTWDTNSTPGPNVDDGGTFSGSATVSWLIEQSTAGIFGIFAALVPVAGTEERCYFLTLSADLITWSTRTEVSGQSAGSDYHPSGIARGAGGRIHGLIQRQIVSSGDYSVEAGLVVTTGGTIGGGLAHVADGYGVPSGLQHGGAHDGSNIMFLFSKATVGLGTTYQLNSAAAASADSPTFTIADLEPTPTSDIFAFDPAVCGAGGGAFDSVRTVYVDGDLIGSVYSGSWTDLSSLGVSGFNNSCRTITDGLGILYCDGSNDVYFLSVVAVSGFVCTGETIPSAEEFFKSHGTIGGGPPVNCGTPTIVPPSEQCNENPPTDVPPGERNACPIGIGYSF